MKAAIVQILGISGLLDFLSNKLLYVVRYWNKFPSTMLKIL